MSREVGAYHTAQKLSELERIAHLQGAHLIVSPILDSALSRDNTKSDERYLRLIFANIRGEELDMSTPAVHAAVPHAQLFRMARMGRPLRSNT